MSLFKYIKPKGHVQAEQALKRLEKKLSLFEIQARIPYTIPLGDDEWVQVMEGMEMRRSNFDGFDKGTALLCRTDRQIDMPSHFHSQREMVFVLSGTIRMEVNGRITILKPGESISISPNQYHQPTFLEPTYCLVVLLPPLPEKITT